MTKRRKILERRFDRYGELRLMVEAGGYVMVRRKGAMPFVISWREWAELPHESVEPANK